MQAVGRAPQGAGVCLTFCWGVYSFCYRNDLKPEIWFPGAALVTEVFTPWDPTLTMGHNNLAPAEPNRETRHWQLMESPSIIGILLWETLCEFSKISRNLPGILKSSRDILDPVRERRFNMYWTPIISHEGCLINQILPELTLAVAFRLIHLQEIAPKKPWAGLAFQSGYG